MADSTTKPVSSVTDALARRIYAGPLKLAHAYGQDRYERFIDRAHGDFHDHAMHALTLGIIADVKEKHAKLRADAHAIDGMQAFDLRDGKALAVSLDGVNLMVVWSELKDEGAFVEVVGVMPWFDPAPESMLREIDTTVTDGLPRMSPALEGLLARISAHGGLPFADSRTARTRVPMCIEEIVAALDALGIEAMAHGYGYGVSRTTKRARVMDVAMVCRQIRDAGMLSNIAKLAQIFEVDAKRIADPVAKCHAKALQEGCLEELYLSTAALKLDSIVERFLPRVPKLMQSCAAFDLSRSMALAYADTDRRIYVERSAYRDVWFHENLELPEGSAFVTVLRRNESGYQSIDAYLVDSWHGESRFDDPEERDSMLDAEAFYGLVARNGYVAPPMRIAEDELLQALDAGVRPLRGRMFSYDIAGKSLRATPELLRSDYLAYFEHMLAGDLNAFARIDSPEVVDMPGTELHHRPKDAKTALDRVVVDLLPYARARAGDRS